MPTGGALIDQFVERGEQRDLRAPARLLGTLYLTGGAIGIATTWLPSGTTVMRHWVWLLCGVAILVGLLLRRWHGRRHRWLLDCAVAFSSIVITGGIVLDQSPSSSAVAFYVWSTLFAFYFLDFRRAMLQLSFIGACYAGALVATAALDPVDHFVTRMAVLAGVGPLVGLVKQRIRRLVDELEAAAELDALTGAWNRRGCGRLLEDLVDAGDPGGELELSIIVADVDYFKDINDEHGHAAGDVVLVEVATILREMADEVGAFVARMGGEEFAIVAPIPLDDAAELAERVRARLDRAVVAGIDLTVSCGVASWGTHGTRIDELLGSGDEALMAAKASGRNRVIVHDEQVRELLPKIAARREAGREMHVATLVTLAEVLDMRDGGTSDHARLVGRLSEEVAIRLGLDRQDVERVRIAGVLHDIGKVAIPDSLLLKPAALTDDEWELMRSHPEIGARVITSIGLRDVRSFVLHHHERIDGAGYPARLSGDEIPLGARIVSAADAFEAMIARRPYKPPMRLQDALAELERCAGSQFDPDVVRELVALVRSGVLGTQLRARFELVDAPSRATGEPRESPDDVDEGRSHADAA